MTYFTTHVDQVERRGLHITGTGGAGTHTFQLLSIQFLHAGYYTVYLAIFNLHNIINISFLIALHLQEPVLTSSNPILHVYSNSVDENEYDKQKRFKKLKRGLSYLTYMNFFCLQLCVIKQICEKLGFFLEH